MAETIDEDVKSAIKKMGYVVRNEKANRLTIPQLKEAIKILKSKQEGATPEIKDKLAKEIDSFAIASEKLRRFDDHMTRGSDQMKNFIRGKRDTMTIASLRAEAGKETGGHNRTYQFGAAGLAHELAKEFDPKKIALGVGIAALGLGVAGMITQQITGQALFAALGSNGALAAVGTFLTANPLALAAVISGASLIVARKVLPKIIKAVKANNANRRAMRETQIELDELVQKDRADEDKKTIEKEEDERLKGRTGLGSLNAADFGDNFASNKDKLVQALVDYGEMDKSVIATWTTTQKTNYYSALKEAQNKKKELDDKIKETDGTKEKEDEEKAEQDRLDKEEEERKVQIAEQRKAALKILDERVDAINVGDISKDQIDKVLNQLTSEVKDLLTDHDKEMLRIKLDGKTQVIKDVNLEEINEEERELWTPEKCADFVKKTPKQFLENALNKALKAKTISQEQYDMMLAMGMQK